MRERCRPNQRESAAEREIDGEKESTGERVVEGEREQVVSPGPSSTAAVCRRGRHRIPNVCGAAPLARRGGLHRPAAGPRPFCLIKSSTLKG